MALTHELKDAHSPIRTFIDRRLPDTRAVAARLRTGLDGATTIAAPVGAIVGQYPRTQVGHAASIRLGLMFSPHIPPLIRDRNPATGERWVATDELHKLATTTIYNVGAHERAPSASDNEALCRICYVLGLFDQLNRTGLLPGLLLLQVPAEASVEAFLALAPPAVLDDLCAISDAALEPLSQLPREAAQVGPSFVGGRDVGGADADLIAGSCLVEIKTSEEGRVDASTVRQLVAYALLDYDDRYQLDEVALYLARKARLLRLPLDELVHLMSSQPYTLAELRSGLRAALARP